MGETRTRLRSAPRASRATGQRQSALGDDQRKWLKRRADIRERGWNLGNELLGKVEQMVKLPIIEQIKDQVIEKDGQATVTKRAIIKPLMMNAVIQNVKAVEGDTGKHSEAVIEVTVQPADWQ
ncbi:MAG TPA: hypothetical protein VEZ90_10425 [Blastocatellia bacterium]|nr:hypothetical protein [Blastocatellia bacterium]